MTARAMSVAIPVFDPDETPADDPGVVDAARRAAREFAGRRDMDIDGDVHYRRTRDIDVDGVGVTCHVFDATAVPR